MATSYIPIQYQSQYQQYETQQSQYPLPEVSSNPLLVSPYLDAATWDAGADPLTDADYAAILQKIFPEAWPSAAGDFYLTLKARHFIYSHSRSGIPRFHNGIMIQQSDCAGGGTNLGGTGTELTALGDIGKTSKFAGLGGSIGGQIGSAIGSGSLVGITSIIGWATFGIGLVLAPLAFISAHHAKAVALEQHDICGATVGGNAMLDDIDAQFYADQITEAQAGQGLDNLKAGLMQIVQPVYTGSGRTKTTCNAACATMLYFDGLVEMRKHYLYPIHTAGLAAKILPAPISQGISTIGSSVSNLIGTASGGAIKLSSNMGFLLLLFVIAMAIGIKNLKKVAA